MARSTSNTAFVTLWFKRGHYIGDDEVVASINEGWALRTVVDDLPSLRIKPVLIRLTNSLFRLKRFLTNWLLSPIFFPHRPQTVFKPRIRLHIQLSCEADNPSLLCPFICKYLRVHKQSANLTYSHGALWPFPSWTQPSVLSLSAGLSFHIINCQHLLVFWHICSPRERKEAGWTKPSL